MYVYRAYSKQAEMQLTYSSSSSLAMLRVQIGRWRQQLHTLLRTAAMELHISKHNNYALNVA